MVFEGDKEGDATTQGDRIGSELWTGSAPARQHDSLRCPTEPPTHLKAGHQVRPRQSPASPRTSLR